MSNQTQSLSIRATFVALFLTVFSLSQAQAQVSYKIGSASTVMTLSGTSTLHDWTMSARKFSCDASFDVTTENQLRGLKAFTVTLPVKNLKGESDGLNDNAYEALKADKFKNMTFKLTSATITPTGEHTANVAAIGNMTIAGVTKSISLNVATTVNDDGTIYCTGSIPLKMTDYHVKPPSFMLGAMKAGNAMTLKYEIMLVK